MTIDTQFLRMEEFGTLTRFEIMRGLINFVEVTL